MGISVSKLKSNLILLVAAAIWGLAFVAQRVGMEYLGPFTFNGMRFALGALSLVPLLLFYSRQGKGKEERGKGGKEVVVAGGILGLVIFTGASLQQIGLIYTTAGKAAFITCLYIVLVPMAGIFLKQYISPTTWLGCITAIAGLYLICVKDDFTISYGEGLQLLGAFFWTIHILLIDRFSKKVDVLKFSFVQFATCAILSLVTAGFLETITLEGIRQSLIPLLYGGICSVGVAYTLQIVGQKHAEPSHAAIILSMETVFAAIGGWLILNEQLGTREFWGCAVMLVGMLLSQFQNMKKSEGKENEMQDVAS